MNNSIIVDFNVSSNLYFLKIEDLSCWGVSETKPAVIEITLPGYSKPIRKYFPKNNVVYDAESLDLVCNEACVRTELPDGIYKIKLSASPSSFFNEVFYLKTDKLRKTFDLAYISNLSANECTSCHQEFISLEFKMRQLEALVRQGEVKQANYLYSKIEKKVNKLKNCKDC